MSEDPAIAREIKQMRREPLLRVEKLLILWSLGLGIGLLALLIWISGRFFPA